MSRKPNAKSFRGALTAASVLTVGGAALLIGALTGGATAAAPLPSGPVLTIFAAPSSSAVPSSPIVAATTSTPASITLTTATTPTTATATTITTPAKATTASTTPAPKPTAVQPTAVQPAAKPAVIKSKPTLVKNNAAPVLIGPASTVALPWGSADIVDATVQDSTLEPPSDPRVVGRWADGAALGAKIGTTLLTSHVNFGGVAGIFEQLSTLTVGQDVTTADASGHATRWVVTKNFAVSKAGALPAEIFAGTTGPRRLVLVTCGGDFDAAARNYLSNVIVELSPVVS